MNPQWWAKRIRAGEPGRPTALGLWLLRWLFAPLVRLMHRPRLEGTEHLPLDRPFLMVSNHSGALAASELLSFACCYLQQVGPARPLAGLAHPFGFVLWPFTLFVRGVGAVPSTYEAAHDALARGVPLLVFPGGDHEAARPIWQANRVTFGGRKGFLRIARSAAVPIIPMGIRGSHYSVPILLRSRALAWVAVLPRALGIKRVPLTLLGLVGAVALAALLTPRLGWAWTAAAVWAWTFSPLAMIPWVPSTIRMRIGAPIPPDALFPDSGDATLEAAYARVEGAVQALVSAP